MRRGGIIGLGNVAIHGHLPGWLARSDVVLAAAADVRPDQRARCAELLPGARWYDSPADLLDREALDFVDICAPPSSHAALVHRALERGLHVLCEKPLVSSREELQAVAAAATRAGRVLHTVHNWHHAPIIRRTRELVSAGEIGRVRHVLWETLRTRPAVAGDGQGLNWRVDPAVAGGGVLTDHGWHVAYVVPAWIDARPTAVAARLETRRHTAFAVEDTAAVRLTFPEATADILLTWAADERRNTVELEGTDGRIELRGDTIVLTRAGSERRFGCPPPLSDGSHHPDWFHPIADRFLAAASGEGPAGNLAEAALCVEIEALARESSLRSGESLPCGPLPAGSRL
ncbi:MAG TPA: Gfo/Idh/MocA family oxidoreductase [Candidatus Acidoferrum sp.]|nr:Gfo/Idh/MocA family oxidoreductase [Candidatus Acidoferrum sp.]